MVSLKNIFGGDKGRKPTYDQVKKFIRRLKEETEKEIIKINVKTGVDLKVINSKFGGIFYLPKGEEVPKNNKGEDLTFLAQINCEELPENNLYPKKGIMQFWIFSDDLYGANFENLTEDNTKRVIYYSQIEEHYSKDELTSIYNPPFWEDGEFYSPYANKEQELGLEFTLTKQGILERDFRFEKIFISKWNESFSNSQIENYWEVWDIVENFDDIVDEEFYSDTNFSQIGGYGYFTQTDPREFGKNKEYTELLLQIDSSWTGDYEIMWGDCGVANYFVTKEQIERLDFAGTLYTWDCS